MYLPYNLAGENFWLYRRGSGKWDPEELIGAYAEAAKTPMEDNPVDDFGESILNEPVEFKEWKQNLEVGIGILSSYNSHCKLIIETDLLSYSPQYQMLILYLEDWSTFEDTHDEEVKRGSPNGEVELLLAEVKMWLKLLSMKKI